MDFFANIAAKGVGGKAELLTENAPQQREKKFVRLESSAIPPIHTGSKISTKEELYEALAQLREQYRPWLANHAPAFSDDRTRIQIKNCTRNGEAITLPYYGDEVGSSLQVYESVFELNAVDAAKSYYICFKGADYKAVVYINGRCVGTHEGFFAPFEFDFSDVACVGKNTLKIELYNDFIYMGNTDRNGHTAEGDKLYAATGIGWDDAQLGWHHCPPGMGIYNDLYVEVRDKLFVKDVFVDENAIKVTVVNDEYIGKKVVFRISVYGQNFEQTVVQDWVFCPQTERTVGMGDSLTESMQKENLGKLFDIYAEKGENVFEIPFDTTQLRKWSPDAPHLYQIQIELEHNDTVCDRYKTQFGVRSFVQDTQSSPKGMFYLNGEKIRLRGANTMGFEQQDVMHEDYDQLIDDILLAKLCNMNFLRLTQRPVQDKVYEYCDKLGMMTQTDLPLFGCMRRSKFAEGIRQAEEMELLVRNHPCNVVISYINEPFPNANNKPHRHLKREELESFFDACDRAVRLHNPNRVIKHVDGDYDPPCESMPDNHCYPMWYNGHGIDIGLLNKGYWLPTKPDWYYGCGEYGAEGLDFYETMVNDYPSDWLQEPFDPNNIIKAQTGAFHYFFYDTCDDIREWIAKSQEHQAFATRIMTEAFRRDPRMISNAIHLFIDAWPSGWMKTIMDYKRNPKPAYFAYRDALEPMMLSLRTDRFTYFADEEICVEAYICNDTNKAGNYKVVFEAEGLCAEVAAAVAASDVSYAADAVLRFPVEDRKQITLKAILLDETDRVVTHNSLTLIIYPRREFAQTTNNEIIMMLQPGTYEIAGETVKVKPCGMLPVHFASRKTGHKAVKEFSPKDFSYWYDEKLDMITPICYNTFEAPGFTPILTGGNMDENGQWHKVLICAEKTYKGKKYIICNADLRIENPVAAYFLDNLRRLED